MNIKVELDDLYSCSKCGNVFDMTIVKTIKSDFGSTHYICPLCKEEQYIED